MVTLEQILQPVLHLNAHLVIGTIIVTTIWIWASIKLEVHRNLMFELTYWLEDKTRKLDRWWSKKSDKHERTAVSVIFVIIIILWTATMYNMITTFNQKGGQFIIDIILFAFWTIYLPFFYYDQFIKKKEGVEWKVVGYKQ